MYNFINSVFIFKFFLLASPIYAPIPTNNLSLTANSLRFRVCGAYCGPGWCNNMWLDELESELKSINKKIDRQHKKVDEGIKQLKDLYQERTDITDRLLSEDNDG